MQPTRLRVVAMYVVLGVLVLAAWLTDGPDEPPAPASRGEDDKPSGSTRGGAPSSVTSKTKPGADAADVSAPPKSSGASPTPKLDPRPLDEPAATRPSKVGALSPETVKRAFAAAQGSVRACAAGGARRPQSRLVVDLVIEQRGGRARLRDARAAEGARPNDALWRCVGAALAAVDYSAEGGDAEIGAQLTFDLGELGPPPTAR